MSGLKIPKCPECSSFNVVRDCQATWNIPEQEWEVISLLDNHDCNDCGESDIDPEWVEERG